MIEDHRYETVEWIGANSNPHRLIALCGGEASLQLFGHHYGLTFKVIGEAGEKAQGQ